ncbi:MAG: arylesterase [Azonexus sp.]|nr:arylesterase [Betaproteobacteria bacterium]MBK8918042.1 arylesterase [Betaproteobacteria bacterium]MBP6036787.1 arylesterase [Azonexus sp.]MBP6907316.1 arylesterase [Azonexus sp.]
MRRFLLLMSLLLSTAASAAGTILVFGDSLSAGYGIRADAAWPSLLAGRLGEKRLDYSVANLSISGETTAGGRSRLEAALGRHRPAVVVIALGANDGLRGLPVSEMKDNLAAMIDMSRRTGARILLVGMRMPPNYGAYAREFQAAYRDVASAAKLPLVEFLLAGIAGDARWFQADMLHPTAEAQPRLLDNVWPALAPLLK